MSNLTDSTPDLRDPRMHLTFIQTQPLAPTWEIQAPTPVRPADDLVSTLERLSHSADVQSSFTSNSPTVDFPLEPLSLSNKAKTMKEEMSLTEIKDVISTPDIPDRSKGDVAAVVSPTETAGIYQKKRKRHQIPPSRTWGHFADFFLDQFIESLDSATETAAHGQKKSKTHQTPPPKTKGHFVDYFLDEWIEHLDSATAGSSTMQGDIEQPQTSGKELEFQGRFSS
jgi:hypothetical protein